MIGLSDDVERRCQVRLENDVAAVLRYPAEVGEGRLRARVERVGPWVRAIVLEYPSVRTPFKDRGSDEVVVRQARVVARVRLDAGRSPYPLSAPRVRLDYRELAAGQVPFLGGVFWEDDSSELPAMVRRLLDEVEGGWPGVTDGEPIGIPCLWRRWDLERDLVWIARQLHRLLSCDPSTYPARNDCLCQAAATWWQRQEIHEVPLEPPLGGESAAPRRTERSSFRLRRVEP